MKTLLAAVLVASLTACATSNPDIVSRADAQRMAVVQDATVLSVRPVTIGGSQSGVGAGAGAIVGGVAGSSIGGHRDSIVAGVLGAVAGGVLGNLAERSGTRENGIEIVVQLRNGERRAIVQGQSGESFYPGDPVVLISEGGKTRVQRAPRG